MIQRKVWLLVELDRRVMCVKVMMKVASLSVVVIGDVEDCVWCASVVSD